MAKKAKNGPNMKHSEVQTSSKMVIQEVIDNDEEKMTFSFKYVDLTHPDFSPTMCGDGYLENFLGKLKAHNTTTLATFKQLYDETNRVHPIRWDGKKVAAKYRGGFSSLPPQVKSHADTNSWQFAITRNKHGRVHGFLIEEIATFYVVWLDPNHLVSP